MIKTHDSPQIFFIHPGDVAVGFAADKFETLLGSCVSILFVTPCCKVASICHFVHSTPPPRNKYKDASYASVALRKMDHMMRSTGFNIRLCRAYVFGGGNMFPGQQGMVDVGRMNVEWAFQYLDQKGITVFGSHTGEHCYRKLSWVIGPSDPCQALQCGTIIAT